MSRIHFTIPVLVATAVLCVTSVVADAATSRATDLPVSKHVHALTPGDSRDTVEVRFAEGSDIRVRGNHLVSLSNGRVPALDDALARFPGLQFGRVFESSSEESLAASQRSARAESGQVQSDMNLYFRIQVKPGTDTIALIEALNALDIVESATPAANPAPAPSTPSFVGLQGYRNAASSGGIDAEYAQALAGGKGENVSITDVEYSWNRSHEDLANARVAGSAVGNGTACDPFASQDTHSTNHGTAVLGELTGGSNAFGVTGLAPSAPLRTVNVSSLNANGVCAYNLANAIKVASDNASAGDVILIEQQAAGPRWNGDPNSQVGDVPVEWDQSVAVWTAIHDATSLGRIVIEAGGNGSQNLDDPIYNDAAGTNWFSHDSGAIIVGAGNAPGCTTRGNVPARSRLYFSDYGSRLDLQGWGACVVTTGYGDLQGGTDPNLWYTQDFSGTSSASPIVASSAAVMSSLAKSRGSLLTPATVRSMLKSTGQRQASGEPGNIGPLPNLKTAINALGPKVVETAHVVSGTNLGATSVPVRETWTSSGSAAAQYEVWLYTDGGSPVKQSSQAAPATLLQLERGHKYQFAIRAADAAGIWGDWMVGKKFEVGEYQENYSATYLAYTGNWTRSPWAPASEGNVTVSSTPGDRATFSFTGSNVAWIATKSSNRGQANVYIDGSFVATVDLYSSTTTSAQAIAYTYAWPAVASHTIAVEVVGTAGHPKVDVDAFVRLK